MRSTEAAEPGGFGMENQLPRLGYRGCYPAQKMSDHIEAIVKDSRRSLLASGYHYPLIAAACLIFSLPPIGIPTENDVVLTACSFPVGGYCAILSLRAQNSFVKLIGIPLTTLYFCILLWSVPQIVAAMLVTTE